MPTIYSTVFQSFIRQGFSKTVTHGYAQSFVAATHPHALNTQQRSSFARRNSTRVVGRFPTLGLQSAFHTSGPHNASTTEHKIEKVFSHGGLDAYFEQLQKSQAAAATEDVEAGADAEKEWAQFQFPKLIEWKPSTDAVLPSKDVKSVNAKTLALQEEPALRDVNPLPNVSPEDQAVLAQIDAALEKELENRKQLAALEEEVESLRAVSPELAEKLEEEIHSRTITPISAIRTPASLARTLTPPVDPQSQSYADHLTKLSEAGRFAEIPPVFEAMLVANIRPIATAYNALLLSVIKLTKEKFEVVTKALDVYADMRRRKVALNSDTYSILVGLLASRSLEVASLKAVLEEKRLRFGGMEEPGKFMFASHELEYAILCEDDRLDLALELFEASVRSKKAEYSAETYHQLISACARSGRVSNMLQLFEHMESNQVTPYAATFPAMITAFAKSGDLVSAVECYNEYRNLAIANDKGEATLRERVDSQVYAAVIYGYVISDKVNGAMKFFSKIVKEYGVSVADIQAALVDTGFVQAFIDRGMYKFALDWARKIEASARTSSMSKIATFAADHGDKLAAKAAFAGASPSDMASPVMALLALSVREGDVRAASQYWSMLCAPGVKVTPAFTEPTTMYAIAMIGSGQVAEGLTQSEQMFDRIRASVADNQSELDAEVEEGIEVISKYMSARGISDPRQSVPPYVPIPSVVPSPQETLFSPAAPSSQDTFDPYAHNTDFKGSSLISDDLEGTRGHKGPRLHEALTRFRNIRRAGCHPRYITYAKLISAAAREGKMDLCQEILAMARTDVPLLPQYPVVRYGWSSILDAMASACLTLGDRTLAEQYHQELLAMGATPSANTYGLYITTLKEVTKTFDEASEAVKIFHRAKAEGVEPSSFLYNALIGKLGKARRIDDCLFYFAEMRGLGINPTSVTYGTIVNALCRVSDQKFAEELFDEMEAMPNYKARPAPYNSMMQFFLTTKRDKAKVLEYYERMRSKNIAPTAHTFKLLVDAHATLEPVDMVAAEEVLDMIRAAGLRPEPVHYASLIHARGCVLHDMDGARKTFDSVMEDRSVAPHACLFQALFESMVANHRVAETESFMKLMRAKRIELTPYIANTLIHGWAAEKVIAKAKEIYSALGRERREPSTYEAMTRAYLAVEERENAKGVVSEMLSRGFPSAVVNKVLELLGGGNPEQAALAA